MNLGFEEIFINLEFLTILVIYSRKKELIERVKILNKEVEEETSNSFVKEIVIDVFYGRKELDLKILNLSYLTDFQRKVLIKTKDIPRGKVSTYKKLSEKVGVREGARAVGNVMKFNPFPILIPCHRVIKSNREIGEYGGGKKLKRKLLIFEGVGFENKWKVLNEYVV
ncbi:MAG: MGMT family protein [Caldisericia bacterium]|nr:MGMT family protein [Caldisericia bacterium]